MRTMALYGLLPIRLAALTRARYSVSKLRPSTEHALSRPRYTSCTLLSIIQPVHTARPHSYDSPSTADVNGTVLITISSHFISSYLTSFSPPGIRVARRTRVLCFCFRSFSFFNLTAIQFVVAATNHITVEVK